MYHLSIYNRLSTKYLIQRRYLLLDRIDLQRKLGPRPAEQPTALHERKNRSADSAQRLELSRSGTCTWEYKLRVHGLRKRGFYVHG